VYSIVCTGIAILEHYCFWALLALFGTFSHIRILVLVLSVRLCQSPSRCRYRHVRSPKLCQRPPRVARTAPQDHSGAAPPFAVGRLLAEAAAAAAKPSIGVTPSSDTTICIICQPPLLPPLPPSPQQQGFDSMHPPSSCSSIGSVSCDAATQHHYHSSSHQRSRQARPSHVCLGTRVCQPPALELSAAASAILLLLLYSTLLQYLLLACLSLACWGEEGGPCYCTTTHTAIAMHILFTLYL